MKSWLAVVALLALAAARPARAVTRGPEPAEDASSKPNSTRATPPDTPPAPEPSAGAGPGDAASDAELAEELLTEDAEAADLVWLYSNADEYAPSDATGPPLPAPDLPQ